MDGKRSHYENRLPEKMKWFSRYKLLIIDEIGYLPMDIQGAAILGLTLLSGCREQRM